MSESTHEQKADARLVAAAGDLLAVACFAFSALMIAGTGSAWFAPLMTWWGASMTLGFIVAAR